MSAVSVMPIDFRDGETANNGTLVALGMDSAIHIRGKMRY